MLKMVPVMFYAIVVLLQGSIVKGDDLCTQVVLNDYRIGLSQHLLDVSADEVSSLRRVCQRDVILAGARSWTLVAPEATYSFNNFYQYSGLSGVSVVQAYDVIFMHLGTCSDVKRVTQTEVRTGSHVSGNTSALCLTFTPELEHANLGGHTPGGRIVIDITVDSGGCPGSDVTSDGCVPLCDAVGPINNCPTTVGSASSTTRQPVPSNVPVVTTATSQAASVTAFGTRQHTETSIAARSTTSRPTTSAHNTHAPITSHEISSSHKATTFWHFPTPTARHTTTHVPTFIPSSSLSPMKHTTTANTSHVFIANASTSMVTDINTYGRSTSAANLDTTEGADTRTNDNNVFGLLEGLYVIAGCIVILLLLATAACLVRKRKHRCFTPTPSSVPETTRAGIPWRDNWLVGYHGNIQHGNDSFDLTDSECYYIHSKFMNPADPDLRCVDTSVGNRHQAPNANGVENDHYEDPWPLVRLDSDFVRKAKSIERPGSDNDVIKSDVTKADSQQNGKSTTQVQRSSSHKQWPGMREENPKYNIVRVQRSRSQKSNNVVQHFSSMKSQPARVPVRKRRSSSVYSDGSVSTAFEHVIENEIRCLESALDREGSVDLLGDRPLSKNRGTWRVNEFYAVVSPNRCSNNLNKGPSVKSANSLSAIVQHATGESDFQTCTREAEDVGYMTNTSPDDERCMWRPKNDEHNQGRDLTTSEHREIVKRLTKYASNETPQGHEHCRREDEDENDAQRRFSYKSLQESSDNKPFITNDFQVNRCCSGLVIKTDKPSLPKRSDMKHVANVILTQPYKVAVDGTSGTMQFVK